ncbi:MAG: hypothetical protein V1708_00250 [Candidatus Micrarchaeota archaeon]
MHESVLFVDQDNNCLSAIAEFAFRKAICFRVPATSAGLAVVDPFLHMHARELLRDEGFDFEMFLSFRAKPAHERLIASHDLVFAFNAQDLRALRERFPAHADEMHLLNDFAGESGELFDPCGKEGKDGDKSVSQDGFSKAYAELFSLSKKAAQRL